MPLPEDSTNGHEKRYNLERRPKNLVNVLHRPIEVTTQSGRSLFEQCSPFRSTNVEDNSSAKIPTWPKRAVIGVFMGGFIGLLYFWGPSVKELVASVIAGAIFFSIVAVFGVVLSDKRALIPLLWGLAGAVAGFGWTEVAGGDWMSGAIWGAVFGVVLWVFGGGFSQSHEGKDQKS